MKGFMMTGITPGIENKCKKSPVELIDQIAF